MKGRILAPHLLFTQPVWGLLHLSESTEIMDCLFSVDHWNWIILSLQPWGEFSAFSIHLPMEFCGRCIFYSKIATLYVFKQINQRSIEGKKFQVYFCQCMTMNTDSSRQSFIPSHRVTLHLERKNVVMIKRRGWNMVRKKVYPIKKKLF